MISPSPGRIVWYRPGPQDPTPILLQDNDRAPKDAAYCEWMPFQKGQAAKTEQLERQAGASRPGAGGS